MGTKIPPDAPILANDCIRFPVPAETPKTIYVYFWNIVTCPGPHARAPNMHLFALTQTDYSPCVWEYGNAEFGFKVLLDIRTITPIGLELRDMDLNLYFGAQLWAVVAEHLVFTHEHQVCFPGNVGHHGYATMFWLDAVADLISDMNLPTDADIMMEFAVTDTHAPVYKLCTPKYSMNVKFLITP